MVVGVAGKKSTITVNVLPFCTKSSLSRPARSDKCDGGWKQANVTIDTRRWSIIGARAWGNDQMSGLLEWSTQIVEESSDSVELWKSLSGRSGLGFPRFLRRVVDLVLFPLLFIPFVKLESRNTCRRTLKLFAKK